MSTLFGIGDKEDQEAEAYWKQQEDLYNNLQQPTFEDYQVDPRAANAQAEVLNMMREGATTRGLTDAEQYELAQQQQQNQAQERGSREAIMQGMAARGAGGSGAELAAQLSNQQGSVDRSNMAGQGALANAVNRRQQAQGQYAGQANQQARQGLDVTQMRNQSAQQQYGNQMGMAQARGDIYNQRGQRRADQANQYRQTAGNIAGSVLGAATGIGTALLSDERAKNNIKEERLDRVLSKIPARHFTMGDSPQVGVIAQEMEKIPKAKEMVVEKNGIKGLDRDKAIGFTLAALGDLSRRIDDLR